MKGRAVSECCYQEGDEGGTVLHSGCESFSGENLGAWTRLSRRHISSGLERSSCIREVTEAL